MPDTTPDSATRQAPPLQHLLNFWRSQPGEAKLLLGMSALFLLIFFLPMGQPRFENAVLEGLRLTQWYAREHVILCLLPAFVIAGAMAVYISQGAVMKHLGPDAPKPVAFGVASIAGTLLAVCSCTVLPLFGGIYKRGAGLGAAIAFLLPILIHLARNAPHIHFTAYSKNNIFAHVHL